MKKYKRKQAAFSSVTASPKQLGLRAFQQADYTTAIKHWSKPKLESDSAVRPALAEAYFRRGLARRNELSASLADLQQAADLLPSDARFWYHLGLSLHRADQLDSACAAYARAADLGLQHSGFGFTRAVAELERAPQISLEALPWLSPKDRLAVEPVVALLRGPQGPPAILADSSRNWLERLKSLGQTNLSAKLWEGLANLAAGEGATALTALTFPKGQSLRADAESVRVFYHGLAAVATGNSEAALAEWTEAARAAAKAGRPILPRLKESLAYLHWQRLYDLQTTGQWAAVFKNAQATLAIAPDEPFLLRMTLVAANRLANAAAATGDWTTAITHWQTMRGLLEQTPPLGSLPPVLHNLAVAHEALERWEPAAELWALLLGTLPKRAPKAKKNAAAPVAAGGIPLDEQRTWLRRRILHNYKRAGRPDQAIAHYKQAVKTAPDNLDLRLELATALLANEQEIAARNEVNRVLERDPQHITALIFLAEISQLRGEGYAAEQVLRRALEIDPQHEGARQTLAQALIEKGVSSFNNGHYKLAQQTYTAALDYAPTDLNVLALLADTELVLKNEAAARTHFETALALATPIAYVRVFNCWAKHKDETAARQVLARAEAAGVASPQFYVDVGLACLTNLTRPMPNLPGWVPPPKPNKSDAQWEQWGRELIEKSLSNLPQPGETLRHIVSVLVEEHQYALAIDYGRQMVTLQPDVVEALWGFGSLQAMTGDIAGAKETLRRALQQARKQGKHDLAKEIEQMRREINNPLFGMLGPMIAQLGSGFLDDFSDEDLFR